jgi:hypothetical protein
MMGTLRSALHSQRSLLILSAWLALSTCSGTSCGRRTRFPSALRRGRASSARGDRTRLGAHASRDSEPALVCRHTRNEEKVGAASA